MSYVVSVGLALLILSPFIAWVIHDCRDDLQWWREHPASPPADREAP